MKNYFIAAVLIIFTSTSPGWSSAQTPAEELLALIKIHLDRKDDAKAALAEYKTAEENLMNDFRSRPENQQIANDIEVFFDQVEADFREGRTQQQLQYLENMRESAIKNMKQNIRNGRWELVIVNREPTEAETDTLQQLQNRIKQEDVAYREMFANFSKTDVFKVKANAQNLESQAKRDINKLVKTFNEQAQQEIGQILSNLGIKKFPFFVTRLYFIERQHFDAFETAILASSLHNGS